MAGSGNRFVNAGYSQPKPLIPVSGKALLERAVSMFPGVERPVLVCNNEHIAKTDLLAAAQKLKPNSVLISMPCHKLGPVYTIKAAFGYIPDAEPVIVAYCDVQAKFDLAHFTDFVTAASLDGCLFTHTGFHPHTLSKTKMAFCKVEGSRVVEVKEKACYTDDPFQEHASSGVYYFRTGQMLKHYCQKALDLQMHYNGEYFITLAYNPMVQDGLKIGFYDTDIGMFGTPEEVRNFEAWQQIIASSLSEEDVLRSYRYWRKF